MQKGASFNMEQVKQELDKKAQSQTSAANSDEKARPVLSHFVARG
jgi:hypothetical protein